MRGLLILLAAVAALSSAADPPLSCDRRVYCDSELLHRVQMARLFDDSKTFVDLQMKYDEEKTLGDFEKLLQETNRDPSDDQLRQFVEDYFSDDGELEYWLPPDLDSNPEFLKNIKDPELREFGKTMNDIWPLLSRKVKAEVLEKPEQYSLVPLSHGFMIPGGRFREIYYWDTYWIVEGLLISGMYETAKGVIENLFELLNFFGHVPNGSRWYYQQRSQPPLLIAMVDIYYRYTQDIDFIRDNIGNVEKEIDFWLDNRVVTVEKDGRNYNLLRYHTNSLGPRPESYFEDFDHAKDFNEQDREDFYVDIKNGAESGWDFTSRWFIAPDGSDNGTLIDTRTRYIAPVDLNGMFAGALKYAANFHALLSNPHKAAAYGALATEWRDSIQAVLWNEDDAMWYDYNLRDNLPRRYFYPCNLTPLWQNVVDPELVRVNGPRILENLKQFGAFQFPGGVPVSLVRSGEQWDFPNVWPPIVSIFVNGLENIGTPESHALAVQEAQKYVRSCRWGFQEHEQMFEKYDAEVPGKYGGGGEYAVQLGFGWSNGVVLEFLDNYGDELTAED